MPDKFIKPLYFAYGSNMSETRMAYRVGFCKKIGTLRIKGYELVFNCGWKRHSYANLVKNPQGIAEGVLYELDDEQVAMLDRFECWPYNYEKFYMMKDGRLIFSYISVNPLFESAAAPEEDYFNILKRATRRHGLLHTYDFLCKYERENELTPNY